MLEELEKLIRLQTIDNKLMEIEEEKGDLPEVVDKLNSEIEQVENVMKENAARLQQLNEQRKLVKHELEKAYRQVEKSQAVIYSVKTTREYDAITSEIEQSKAKINEFELKDIELQLQIEDLTSENTKHRERLEQLQKDLSVKSVEMHERVDTNKDSEDKYLDKRNKIIGRLEKPVLSHYERIRKLRDGTAVSYVRDGACSYCFSVLPPQRQAEIRKMEDLILCEVCGCMLVSKEAASEFEMCD